MDWKQQRVLVTGAGGFIGSHLTERLVALGARTRALVRYTSTGTAGWLNASPVRGEIEVVAGDITDDQILHRAAQDVDIVFHLAALIGIPYSYHAPASYVRTNISGTQTVLQAALDCRVSRVVHTSTSEVYGTAVTVPIAEDHPVNAQSPYAATKTGADMLALSYHRSFALPVTIVRPFNTYGPRQSTRAVIPTIIEQALTQPVVRLGHLDPTRDFTYVADTVEGFIAAAASDRAVGGVVNLGAGREISIRDLAALIASMCASGAVVELDADRVRPPASEVERLRADTRRAAELLGWSPRYTLRDGLRETIDWMSAHLDRRRPVTYVI